MPRRKPAPKLTVREGEVMHLVAEGLTSEQIGRRLGIAERTVRKHLSAVYAKAGLNGRAAAAAWWQRARAKVCADFCLSLTRHAGRTRDSACLAGNSQRSRS